MRISVAARHEAGKLVRERRATADTIALQSWRDAIGQRMSRTAVQHRYDVLRAVLEALQRIYLPD